MSELRSALEGLTTHPGFGLFKTEAKRRWGPLGYAHAIEQAIAHAAQTKMPVDAEILAVKRAKDEVNSLFDWIDQQLRVDAQRDEREAAGVSVSRRGPGI